MSWAERIKILLTVMGSNQRLIQDQTVGKKAGAPMIWYYMRKGQRRGIAAQEAKQQYNACKETISYLRRSYPMSPDSGL
jgi:hypothetical protein